MLERSERSIGRVFKGAGKGAWRVEKEDRLKTDRKTDRLSGVLQQLEAVPRSPLGSGVSPPQPRLRTAVLGTLKRIAKFLKTYILLSGPGLIEPLDR